MPHNDEPEVKLDPEELKDRRAVASEYWEPHRKVWHTNMQMYAPDRVSGQWDADAKRQRDDDDRPSLTMNLLAQPVHQIVNSARQNRIGPRLVPVDGRVDKDMAQVFEDWIRSIDYQSRAHIADEYALEMAGAGSYGFTGLTWEWAKPASRSGLGAFEKKLVVYRIPDPARVLADPFSTEPDGSDADWYCIEHYLSEDDYERTWPGEDPEDSDFEIQSNNDEVRIDASANVLEYWTKHYGARKTVYLIADGREIVGLDLAKHEAGKAGVEILDERKFQETTIWKHFTNGKKDLQKPERWFDDECIPIIPTWGKELWIRNKRTFRSVIQDSSEPQQFVNYMITKAAEVAGRASLEAAVVDPRGIQGHPEWDTSNTKNHPYKRYHFWDFETNQAIPPPSYNQRDIAVQGLSLMVEQGRMLTDATHGVTPSNRGEKEPGINSGRQTLALQRTGDTANFHFPDNMARAVEQRYRIMLRVLPRMLAEGATSVERAIRVIGDDRKEQIVTVFQATKEHGLGFEGPAMKFKAKTDNGSEGKVAPLDPGMYDVRVHAGKSVSTQKQEKLGGLIEIQKSANPEMSAVMMPDVVRAIDMPEGDKLAAKLEKTLPEHLREEVEGGPPPLPPEVQQQIQEMQGTLQAMDKKLQEYEFKDEANVVDNQAKASIEQMKKEYDGKMETLKQQVEMYKAQLADQQGSRALMVDIQKTLETLKQPTPAGPSPNGNT